MRKSLFKPVTFKKGGIHPLENKHLSAHKAIVELPLPDQLSINLSQHLGKKAKAIVEKKQVVCIGDVIAEADGPFSALIHAPASGTIKRIEEKLSAQGIMETTIVIEVNKEKTGIDRSKFETLNEIDLSSFSREELIKKIQQNGIVGQGGAAFPTHMKLSPPLDKQIDVLIINGAECEPYLTADHQLMLEKSMEIIKGTLVLAKILGVEHTFIGIEQNKFDAIDLFTKILNDQNITHIQVIPLITKYPQGGEKQLINAITGRDIPSGQLPFDIGVVVHNVGTAFSIYEALYYNKPVMDRVTTITGFVKNPGNFRIKIGTSFQHAIDTGAQGFLDEERVRSVINGGPMMGQSVRQLDVTVMKGTGGIVALADAEITYQDEGPCIRCSRCIDVCPINLMPLQLADDTIMNNGKLLRDALDCIECGNCSYICPTNRKLVHWIKIGKKVYRTWKVQEEKFNKNI